MSLAAEDCTLQFAYYAKKGIEVTEAGPDSSDPCNIIEAYRARYALNGRAKERLIVAKAGTPRLFRGLDAIVREIERARRL